MRTRGVHRRSLLSPLHNKHAILRVEDVSGLVGSDLSRPEHFLQQETLLLKHAKTLCVMSRYSCKFSQDSVTANGLELLPLSTASEDPRCVHLTCKEAEQRHCQISRCCFVRSQGVRSSGGPPGTFGGLFTSPAGAALPPQPAAPAPARGSAVVGFVHDYDPSRPEGGDHWQSEAGAEAGVEVGAGADGAGAGAGVVVGEVYDCFQPAVAAAAAAAGDESEEVVSEEEEARGKEEHVLQGHPQPSSPSVWCV
jgi:hypothetical protein